MVDNESREKRQRVESFLMNKGKGSVIDDIDKIGDDVDLEDDEYISEKDLVIIDAIRA